MSSPIVKGFVVPGIPHPLLCPEKNEGWQKLRDAFEVAKTELQQSGADVLLIYSTMWPSVIGHQIQAHPEPEWVHVDEMFHDLGSIPYKFRMDSEFANELQARATARGLESRTVSYHGFPIDTGSVVALKLLNPNNEIPACILSSNMYADRAESIVLGKSVRDALQVQGKKAAVVVVATLSNRLFTNFIDPADDHIHSEKDEEWNQKMLEFFADGRLEDLSQLSREIHKQVRVQKVVNYKPMWWLSATMGQHNNYNGKVHAYAPLYGTGAAVISLTPSGSGVGDKEFDEDDVEVYHGDRNVVVRSGNGKPAPIHEAHEAATPVASVSTIETEEPIPSPSLTKTWEPRDVADVSLIRTEDPREIVPPSPVLPTVVAPGMGGMVTAAGAPKPVGAYPHARRIGDLLYLSGVGPRQAGTDDIPGGPIVDKDGEPRDYDVKAQTRAVIENIKQILAEAGSSLDRVFDVTAFLVDMKRDFKAYNEIYAEYFTDIGAARTTVEIQALPTPIAVEFKVIASMPE